MQQWCGVELFDLVREMGALWKLRFAFLNIKGLRFISGVAICLLRTESESFYYRNG